MTISITHFDDSAGSYDSVYIDAYARNINNLDDRLVAIESVENKLTYVGLKMEGRVAVIPSTSFYKFFENDTSNHNLDGLINQYFNKSPFPICVRYQSEQCIVIERPPFKVSPTIHYGKRYWKRKSAAQKELEMWIPWTVMILVSSEGFSSLSDRNAIVPYLFFRNAPLNSFDDVLSLPYTPNVFKDGRICLGETENRLMEMINNKAFSVSDINELYSFIANEYFMGGWNLDLGIPGLTHHVDSDPFSSQSFLELKRIAEKTGNKYILSFLKRYGMDRPIRSYDQKYYIRFYMNYLSCLDLDSILEYTKEMMEDKNNPLAYSMSLNPKNKLVTLGDILADKDLYFYDLYKDKYLKSLKNRSYFSDNSQGDLSKSFSRYCISNSFNKTPLHTLSMVFKFNLDDFLTYASDRILNAYLVEPVRFYELRGVNRQKFFKKNIADHILNYSSVFNELINEYFFKVQSRDNGSFWARSIDNFMKDLGNFYRSSEGLEKIKNKVTVDLTELGLVLDKSFLTKDELV